MRSSILAVVLVASLPACLVGSGEIGGGGDDDNPVLCGNGAMDTGETCDDGNTTAGDGCSATCQMEAVPKLMGSLDKTAITADLGTKQTVTVTLTSSGGFAGTVQLAPSVLNATMAPLTTVTVMGPMMVDVPANGTQTAQYTIDVPTNATGAVVNGTFKVAVTSSLGAQDVTATATISNIYIVGYAAGTGASDPNHMNAGGNLNIKRGTILRFVNNDTVTHIIHGDDTNFPHENQNAAGAGVPGRTYEINTTGIGPGQVGVAGCHSHGTASYARYTIQ